MRLACAATLGGIPINGIEAGVSRPSGPSTEPAESVRRSEPCPYSRASENETRQWYRPSVVVTSTRRSSNSARIEGAASNPAEVVNHDSDRSGISQPQLVTSPEDSSVVLA